MELHIACTDLVGLEYSADIGRKYAFKTDFL